MFRQTIYLSILMLMLLVCRMKGLSLLLFFCNKKRSINMCNPAVCAKNNNRSDKDSETFHTKSPIFQIPLKKLCMFSFS